MTRARRASSDRILRLRTRRSNSMRSPLVTVSAIWRQRVPVLLHSVQATSWRAIIQEDLTVTKTVHAGAKDGHDVRAKRGEVAGDLTGPRRASTCFPMSVASPQSVIAALSVERIRAPAAVSKGPTDNGRFLVDARK